MVQRSFKLRKHLKRRRKKGRKEMALIAGCAQVGFQSLLPKLCPLLQRCSLWATLEHHQSRSLSKLTQGLGIWNCVSGADKNPLVYRVCIQDQTLGGWKWYRQENPDQIEAESLRPGVAQRTRKGTGDLGSRELFRLGQDTG